MFFIGAEDQEEFEALLSGSSSSTNEDSSSSTVTGDSSQNSAGEIPLDNTAACQSDVYGSSSTTGYEEEQALLALMSQL